MSVFRILWLCRQRQHHAVKSEILSTKFETNLKIECTNDGNKPSALQSSSRKPHKVIARLTKDAEAISFFMDYFFLEITCSNVISSKAAAEYGSLGMTQRTNFQRSQYIL
jgi:hypothetical protein